MAVYKGFVIQHIGKKINERTHSCCLLISNMPPVILSCSASNSSLFARASAVALARRARKLSGASASPGLQKSVERSKSQNHIHVHFNERIIKLALTNSAVVQDLIFSELTLVLTQGLYLRVQSFSLRLKLSVGEAF